MISADPLKRLLVEKGMTLDFLKQLTGLSSASLNSITKGKCITPHNIDLICSVLQCQPCDIIEFVNTETKGHWVWVEELN